MQRCLRSPMVRFLAILFLATSCSGTDAVQDSSSALKSDWLDEASPGGLRTYGIDWACEPKQYGASAETRLNYQDEYCEWKTARTTDTEKQCRFTVSFDRSRDFYLNSRGKTPVNSISAARQLVRDCSAIALRRLKQGQTPGQLCSGISSGCAAGRNSDPEICDKVRWATGEKYKGNINYCVDQLSPSDWTSTERPLMQFGVLSDIPENCEFADEEKTELLCTIPAEDTCFSIAGQIRVGLRVITKAKIVESNEQPVFENSEEDAIFDNSDSSNGSGIEAPVVEELPSTRECFVP